MTTESSEPFIINNHIPLLMSSEDADSDDNTDSEEDESISLATFDGAVADLSAADDEEDNDNPENQA